ncbi:helix-turn-helix domain-containing protein [Streptomyces sp. NPDC000410]|uniref:helix-turn-helix domain-containing protein n=1 Tax=Streptomyces sp. NPDC000410 TaxID=3154254 RepID=UPI003323BD1C
MQFHEEPSIGDRVARLRMRRKLTQEGLAERAGLSVDVIRKLEQGVRQTARLTTLNALARALDVEPSTLVAQPTTFEVRSDDEQPSVLALRQAVSPVSDLLGQESDPEEAPTVAQLRASLQSTERIRREGRMGEIGLMHKEDAAFTALERSMQAAREGDDPHLVTVGVSSLAWIFTKQGRLADAEQLAMTTAERIETGFRSQPVELALSGVLLLRAATAAVRRSGGTSYESCSTWPVPQRRESVPTAWTTQPFLETERE